MRSSRPATTRPAAVRTATCVGPPSPHASMPLKNVISGSSLRYSTAGDSSDTSVANGFDLQSSRPGAGARNGVTSVRGVEAISP